MQTQTIVFIIGAIILALGITIFTYRNVKSSPRLRLILAALRFLTIFLGLLLLINPEFEKNSYYTEKANLVLLVDQSSSISEVGGAEEAVKIVDELTQNSDLQGKYSIQPMGFAQDVGPLDSLVFSEKMTNITYGLETIKETFSNTKNNVVLITDGNHTYGKDYEYFDLGDESLLNTVVLGDTTSYDDIGIGLINRNRYAFLGNQFPLEIQMSYSGQSQVRPQLILTMDGRRVHQEAVEFSSNNRSRTLNVLLKAESTGIKTIRVELTPLDIERNTRNNTKEIAIEIIDEKTKVGIVSSFKHPDLGALKRAIESNEQRQVTLLSPSASVEELEEIDVFILYQPSGGFEGIYNFISNKGMGKLTIAGPNTDWNFLNGKVQTFAMENYGQDEEILPSKNEAFELFDISGIQMSDLPPLQGNLGELTFSKEPKVIAYQQIRGVNLNKPLFFISEEDKDIFLLGANIWKWRLSTFKNTNDFVGFDELVGKLIFYLSSSGKKERLQLDYKNVYENSAEALIRASFFDKTYDFKENASLMLRIKGANGFDREVPMLPSGNQFQADLSNLEEGDYTFTVSETTESISKSGQFRILDFDLEKQFLTSNHQKLARLAERNSGKLYYPNQEENLLNELLADTEFLPVQKSIKNVVSLIDFRVVLAIMALSLALEWFIRKYNGLL